MAIGVVANTNVPSISASRILASNRAGMEKAMERLSSGKRINSASDDAAGMAVAAKIRADVRSIDQAVRNTNDAISLVNTYDGAAAEIESILVRMKELAVQMANETYTDEDRSKAQAEFGALQEEIDRIAENTEFNRQVLATGSASFKFQVGPKAGATGDEVSVNLANISASDLSVSTSVKISSQGAASTAITDINTALESLATARAEAGARINRLNHTVNNLMNVSQRQKEALSGIEDADYAGESAALARGMVLAQAGTAMLAQANQAPQYILTLLRS